MVTVIGKCLSFYKCECKNSKRILDPTSKYKSIQVFKYPCIQVFKYESIKCMQSFKFAILEFD